MRAYRGFHWKVGLGLASLDNLDDCRVLCLSGTWLGWVWAGA